MCKVICGYCGSTADLIKGNELYPKHPELASNSYYECKPCNARVGCHPHSDTPLGTLANGKLRRLRSKAHKEFDLLYKKGYMTRKQAYTNLSYHMGIPTKFTHIGAFDEDKVLEVLLWSKNKLKELGYYDTIEHLEKQTEEEDLFSSH